MDKTTALKALIELTDKTLGYTPSTPTEFAELSLLILKKTGHSLSVSSIKRIWGYVRYDSFPSTTTLNILAQYNNFRDWDTFLLSHNGTDFDDSGFVDETAVCVERLTPGDRLLLKWGQGKSCEIEYLSHFRFCVNQSRNIKLLAGDTFTLNVICQHHPLYISDIHRGDSRIPAYIGARKGGIKSITLIPA